MIVHAPSERERAGGSRIGDQDLSLTRRFPDVQHRAHLNEVPFPPLPGVEQAVREALTHAARYPDNDHTELTGDLAAHLGVDPSCIAVGAGGTGLIQQILLATVTAPDDEVVFGWPSFDGYPLLVRQVRAVPVAVPLVNAAQDLEAMAAAITPRTRLVFVCSPNNPTGTEVGDHDLQEFLAQVPDRVTVVVDLAYVEFSTRYAADPARAGGTHLLHGHPNVVVLRTFSKAYGLAALRVGYAVAPPGAAAAVRAAAVPFSVTVPAKRAAAAALRAQSALQERVRFIATARDRLHAELCALGIPVPSSQGNFLWLPVADPVGFADACQHRGLLVRAVPGHGARATVGLPAANEHLLSTARAADDLRHPAHSST